VSLIDHVGMVQPGLPSLNRPFKLKNCKIPLEQDQLHRTLDQLSVRIKRI